MPAANFTLVLHDELLFGEGGVVGRWGQQVKRDVTSAIKVAAPFNRRTNKSNGQAPGELKRGISGSVSRAGLREIEVLVSSRARYSTYVINGTPAYIYFRGEGGQFGGGHAQGADVNAGFAVPYNPGFPNAFRPARVKGQHANDFMSKGVVAARVKHSSLSAYTRNAVGFTPSF